jgi:hypothetical protein
MKMGTNDATPDLRHSTDNVEEAVFSSESAMMESLNQEVPLRLARNKAESMMEKMAVNRMVLLGDESFNGWPKWAVPASFGEVVASTPLSPELWRQGKKERGKCDCMRRVWKCWMAVICGDPCIFVSWAKRRRKRKYAIMRD